MSDKKIKKIVLANERHQVLMLPKDAVFLTVQTMPSVPGPGIDVCLWGTGERGQLIERHIGIFDDGDVLPQLPTTYIGTFQNPAQTKAFHVFELTPLRRMR